MLKPVMAPALSLRWPDGAFVAVEDPVDVGSVAVGELGVVA